MDFGGCGNELAMSLNGLWRTPAFMWTHYEMDEITFFRMMYFCASEMWTQYELVFVFKCIYVRLDAESKAVAPSFL